MANRRKVSSAKLVALREGKKLDQTELAVRLRARGLGTTQATISRWENGKEPRAYALSALASELGCAIEELFADDDAEAASMSTATADSFGQRIDDLLTERAFAAVDEALARRLTETA